MLLLKLEDYETDLLLTLNSPSHDPENEQNFKSMLSSLKIGDLHILFG